MQNKLDASPARLDDDVNDGGYNISRHAANRGFHFQSPRRQINNQLHRLRERERGSESTRLYCKPSHLIRLPACYSRPVQYRSRWLFVRTIASSQFRLYNDDSKRHKASDGERWYWLSVHFAPKPMSRASARRLSRDIATDEEDIGMRLLNRLLLMSLITFSFPGDFPALIQKTARYSLTA